MAARLIRRLLFTLSLVVGATLVLFVVFESGLLGDAARVAAGPRASARTVAETRLRLGEYARLEPRALRVTLPAGAAVHRLRSLDGRGIAWCRADGLPLSRWPQDHGDTIAAVADWLRSLRPAAGNAALDVEVLADPALPARGLATALADQEIHLRPGAAAALPWARRVPLGMRLARQVGGLLRFEFGRDRDGRPIAAQLRTRGARSLALSLPAFLLATLVAVCLALWTSSIGGRADRVLTLAASLAMSVSSLAYILFLRKWLAVDLGWFPVRPWSPPVLPLLFLPVLIWVVVAVWPDLRLYRALAWEMQRAPWAVAARARGLSPRAVRWRHVLPNLLVPVLMQVAVTLPFLFTGSLLLERVFDIPGLGDAVVRAVEEHDQAMLRAVTFLFAIFYLAAQWLADATAAVLDPRLATRGAREEAS